MNGCVGDDGCDGHISTFGGMRPQIEKAIFTLRVVWVGWVGGRLHICAFIFPFLLPLSLHTQVAQKGVAAAHTLLPT